MRKESKAEDQVIILKALQEKIKNAHNSFYIEEYLDELESNLESLKRKKGYEMFYEDIQEILKEKNRLRTYDTTRNEILIILERLIEKL